MTCDSSLFGLCQGMLVIDRAYACWIVSGMWWCTGSVREESLVLNSGSVLSSNPTEALAMVFLLKGGSP